MKKFKLLLILTISLYLGKLNAQITLENTYAGNLNITVEKLGISGYKYSIVDISNNTVNLYNMNHSLFKSITIPPVLGAIQNLSYISETLFDSDNLIEYVVQSFTNSPVYSRKFYVFKENGSIVMMRDSAETLFGNYGIFNSPGGIFSDGVNTKLKLSIYSSVSTILKTEIYTLPGTIPCVECTVKGPVSGISSTNTQDLLTSVFYPNPATDQVKLKYELPKEYKSAEIRIHDIQGKLIDALKVTDAFEFIYLPSNYNNGLYLYSLIVDGNTIKTEKIILNK